MIEVQIRKQGSSAIMTLPSDALKIMGEQIGNTLLIDVERGKLVARSKRDKPRLDDMLASFDKKRHGGEAMAFGPVGKEVI